MRALSYTENPVQQTTNGDLINTRVASNAFTAMDNNFRTLEEAVREMDMRAFGMHEKITACYDFIAWVQQHAPETLTAYKAHSTVLRTFDKAEQGEMGYAETAGPA